MFKISLAFVLPALIRSTSGIWPAAAAERRSFIIYMCIKIKMMIPIKLRVNNRNIIRQRK